MDLRQLRYFIAVAETLNFSRASESLFLSQSALSRQISDLEDELGLRLFDRDNRNVTLTEAGRLLLGEAREILLRTEKIRPLLHDVSGKQEETLFIGIDARTDDDPTIHRILAEQVCQFRKEKPGLRTLFFRREQMELRAEILKGTLSCGIFLHSEPKMDTPLESCLLTEDEMVLVTHEGTPASDSEALTMLTDKNASLVLVEKDVVMMNQILTILDAIGGAPQIRFAENRTAMLLNVESGDGSMILPRSVVRRINNPNLRQIPFPTGRAKVYLLAAWKQGCAESVQRLMQAVSEKAK